jgi:hypothetical protein
MSTAAAVANALPETQRGRVVRFPAKRPGRPKAAPVALATLLGGFGVRILPTKERPGPLETDAAATLQRILDKHGADHLCIVLRCIVETTGNETELRAISECVLTRPDWVERGLSFLEAFDAIDLKALRKRAKGILPDHGARAVLGVLLWQRLDTTLG